MTNINYMLSSETVTALGSVIGYRIVCINAEEPVTSLILWVLLIILLQRVFFPVRFHFMLLVLNYLLKFLILVWCF